MHKPSKMILKDISQEKSNNSDTFFFAGIINSLLFVPVFWATQKSI